MKLFNSIIILLFLLNSSFITAQTKKKAEFIHLKEYIPSIKIELRYASKNNFIGDKINGYHANNPLLTIQAAEALKKVQKSLESKGLSLIIYDAYRPQKAVNHFVKWAKELNDTLMKQQFYPTVTKKNLFKNGYISSHSRHSSGSTIDLSIVNLKTNKVLDMGSPYDYFSEKSWTACSDLSVKQKENRQLLVQTMSKYGFRNYPKEWWHFTLRHEPHRNIYFDFNVE